MGFVLKANNRKVRSGSTITAKIVSPDKKTFIRREYPVIVQKQSLSARDKLIRDKQQIEAILDAANNWLDITTEIKELSTAKNSASNGSFVSTPKIENAVVQDEELGNITYITQDGVVQNRPVYDPTNDSGHSSRLVITLTNEGETDQIIREFIIPAYTASDIVNEIRNAFSSNVLWNLIRKDNHDPDRVSGNFNDITGNALDILDQLGIKNKIKYDNQEAIPQLTVTYPDYHSTSIVSNKTTYNRLGISETYSLKTNSNYSISAVVPGDILNAAEIGLNEQYRNISNTIAYSMKSSDKNNNLVTARWTLGSDSVTVTKELGFLSSLVTNEMIRRTMNASAHIGWFLSKSYFEEAIGLEDTIMTVTSGNVKTQISIPENCNIVFKLPKTIKNMVDGSAEITDSENIGYKIYSNGNEMTTDGFVDELFQYTLHISESVTTYLSSTPVDVVGNVSVTNPSTENDFLSSKYSGMRYIYIPASELEGVSTIEGVFSIVQNVNSLPDNDNKTMTFSFEITRTPVSS